MSDTVVVKKKEAGPVQLVVTLFLIGAGLSVEKIRSVGWKPLILGIILWVVVSVLSLLVIVNS